MTPPEPGAREADDITPDEREEWRGFDDAGWMDHGPMCGRMQKAVRRLLDALDARDAALRTLTRERDEAREALARLMAENDAWPSIRDLERLLSLGYGITPKEQAILYARRTLAALPPPPPGEGTSA